MNAATPNLMEGNQLVRDWLLQDASTSREPTPSSSVITLHPRLEDVVGPSWHRKHRRLVTLYLQSGSTENRSWFSACFLLPIQSGKPRPWDGRVDLPTLIKTIQKLDSHALRFVSRQSRSCRHVQSSLSCYQSIMSNLNSQRLRVKKNLLDRAALKLTSAVGYFRVESDGKLPWPSRQPLRLPQQTRPCVLPSQKSFSPVTVISQRGNLTSIKWHATNMQTHRAVVKVLPALFLFLLQRKATQSRVHRVRMLCAYTNTHAHTPYTITHIHVHRYHIQMHVHTHTYIHTLHTHTYYIYTCTYTIYKCVRAYTHMHTHILYTHKHKTQTHTNIQTCIHAYTISHIQQTHEKHIHAHAHICICTHIYIKTHTHKAHRHVHIHTQFHTNNTCTLSEATWERNWLRLCHPGCLLGLDPMEPCLSIY